MKLSGLLEKSMSTTVNYDKYRDCDAAILEGLESWTPLTPSFSISPSGYPPYIPKAAADPRRNTVCRPCTLNKP